TTASVARAGLADEVAATLGPGLAGTFTGSKEHTPAPVVHAAAAEVASSGADCLVSLGGSSVVDLAKGAAMVLAGGGDLDRYQAGAPRGPGQPPATLAHLAVPTTLSGAELTGGVGITDPDAGHK